MSKAISASSKERTAARILVVDDEPSMCEFLSIMLGKEGYAVSHQTSANQALTELRQGSRDPEKRFDLVVTDLMMPEMSGLGLLKVSQRIDPGIDFIVMTAFGSIDTAVEALKHGAHGLLTKPF